MGKFTSNINCCSTFGCKKYIERVWKSTPILVQKYINQLKLYTKWQLQQLCSNSCIKRGPLPLGIQPIPQKRAFKTFYLNLQKKYNFCKLVALKPTHLLLWIRIKHVIWINIFRKSTIINFGYYIGNPKTVNISYK